MQPQSVFTLFQELKYQNPTQKEGFEVFSLPAFNNHKIGISASGQPVFFIKCEDEINAKPLGTELAFISVQFNCKCQLNIKQTFDENTLSEGYYTVISLKTDTAGLQEYFLEIVFFIIKKVTDTPKLKELKIEVEKLINLFSKFSKPPTKTIQGLWAELLVIEQAKKPDYLITSWHKASTDKFDFYDGIDKIEVKSTAKSTRIHSFSIEQLSPNESAKLIIASVFVVETGTGKTIFDLLDLIQQKIIDKSLYFNLNEILGQTLGADLEKAFEVFFDYQQGIDSLAFFDSKNILKIEPQFVPKQVSNIRFDSDLTDIKPLKKADNKSKLHQALF